MFVFTLWECGCAQNSVPVCGRPGRPYSTLAIQNHTPSLHFCLHFLLHLPKSTKKCRKSVAKGKQTVVSHIVGMWLCSKHRARAGIPDARATLEPCSKIHCPTLLVRFFCRLSLHFDYTFSTLWLHSDYTLTTLSYTFNTLFCTLLLHTVLHFPTLFVHFLYSLTTLLVRFFVHFSYTLCTLFVYFDYTFSTLFCTLLVDIW